MHLNVTQSFNLKEFIMYKRSNAKIETKLIWSLRKHIGHKGLKYESGCFNVTFSQRDIGCFCCIELHVNVCSLIQNFPFF